MIYIYIDDNNEIKQERIWIKYMDEMQMLDWEWFYQWTEIILLILNSYDIIQTLDEQTSVQSKHITIWESILNPKSYAIKFNNYFQKVILEWFLETKMDRLEKATYALISAL